MDTNDPHADTSQLECTVKDVALMLTTEKPDELARFYAAVFSVNFRTLKNMGGPVWHHGKLGELELRIRAPGSQEQLDIHSNVYLSLTAVNFRETYSKALSQGATAITEPGDGILFARFYDPDGNLIEMLEELPF